MASTDKTPRVPYAKSPCCGAAVVGMVDVTVHPRRRVDGTYGPITDTLRQIQHFARNPVDDPYCEKCGEPVAS